MELFWAIFIVLITMAAGFVIQFFARLSPWLNLAISFPVILFLPFFWGYGLVGGIWICCAFSTFQPELENQIDSPNRVSWLKTVLFSALTFAGFLLTLILIWKLKLTSTLLPVQREIFAWIFFVVIEVSLYKIVARLAPGLHRIPMGYGMAVLNFLMIFYWIYPRGIFFMALVLVTLLIMNPLILTWVEPLVRQGEPYSWRK